MKISLNKLRYAGEHYAVPDLVADGLDALLEKIGAQLGAVEDVVQYGDRFDGVLIVKVVSCEKHPDADKLNVCKIDDGGTAEDVDRDPDGLVQVVCGAPNVRAGMLAAWLPPGATVPATRGKEPFVLDARELRGVVSNGMLASPKELGIGDSHEGLLEVDVDAKPGTTFTEAYRAEGEAVIDIENKMFTHRPDCFGLLGITREVAGIQALPFKSPDWYRIDPEFPAIEGEELKLEVRNELPGPVRRFTAITMSDIKVGPSPIWLQIVLIELGIRPINSVVDYTNFWMLETGQPLHAYDYDKVKALGDGEAVLVIRNPKPDEKIKLLNGKEIEPRPEAIMIATDQRLIGIGGVMGGADTEVDADTKNIILECASFDMYSVRRTSMEHGIFTDAVTRFTKGQSPLQNAAVLAKIVDHIREHDGGKVAGSLIDDNHLDPVVMERGSLHTPVTVSTGFINDRLGLRLSPGEIEALLENVEFDVAADDDKLIVAAPFWRTDIELREDVVEEVGRLYGYDRLPLVLPERDIAPAARDALLDLKTDVRAKLSKAGANEVLTYSFVPGSLLDKTGQDRAQAFEIANALSPDLQYYRLSLIPSLLEKVHPNVKAGYDEFALFELGKTHSLDHKDDDEGLPKEFEFTALVVTANDKLKRSGAPYYLARKYLEALAGPDLVFKPIGEGMEQYAVVRPYDLSRSALVSLKDGDFLGIIGEFKPAVRRALKLPKYTAGFEIDTTVLRGLKETRYMPLSRFPAVKQDITLKVAADLAYEELRAFINKELVAHAPDGANVGLEPVDIYQKTDDAGHKQVTFRAIITDPKRTLTDKEVTVVLDAVAAKAKTTLQAERI